VSSTVYGHSAVAQVNSIANRRKLGRWARKGGIATLDQGLISGSNFLVSILLARWLPASSYGAFGIAFSFYLLILVAYEALVLEPMSVLGPSVYHDSMPGYFATLLRLHVRYGCLWIAVSVLGYVISKWSGLHPGVLSALLGATIAAPFVLLFWLVRRSWYVQLRPARALLGAGLYFSFVLGGLFVLLNRHLLSPFTGFLLMGFAALVAALILLFRADWPGIRNGAHAQTVVSEHWQYGRWALASFALMWVPANLCYGLTGLFHGVSETANLRALMNCALPLRQTLTSAGILALPFMARKSRSSTWKHLKRLTVLIAGVFFGLALLYWIPFMVVGKTVFHVLYRGSYDNVQHYVPLVALASCLQAAVFAPAILMRATRRPRLVVWTYLSSAVVVSAAGIVLTRLFGITGWLWAVVVSATTALLVACWLVREKAPQENLVCAEVFE